MNKKLYLLVPVLIILLGILVYGMVSSVPIRHAVLMAKPRPLPDRLVAVTPAPGSYIAANAFNRQHKASSVRYGRVCFRTHNDILGLDHLCELDHMSLLINKKNPVGYWATKRSGSGPFCECCFGKEQSTDVCWNVFLGPGNYVAELTIKGASSTLVYEWAFRITDE